MFECMWNKLLANQKTLPISEVDLTGDFMVVISGIVNLNLGVVNHYVMF